MAATDLASMGTIGCRCVTGRTSVSTTSSNEDDASLTVNNPKVLPGPCAQAGTLVQPGTIRALRRSFSSSACRSPGARLGLIGSTTAVLHTATLRSAASGPRGNATPTRDHGPTPVACSCAEMRLIWFCRAPNVRGTRPGQTIATAPASRAACRCSTSPIVDGTVDPTPAFMMQLYAGMPASYNPNTALAMILR